MGYPKSRSPSAITRPWWRWRVSVGRVGTGLQLSRAGKPPHSDPVKSTQPAETSWTRHLLSGRLIEDDESTTVVSSAGNSLLLPDCRISSRSLGHSAVRVSALARQSCWRGIRLGNERRGDGGVDHKEQAFDVPETTDLSKHWTGGWWIARCGRR